ncbi:unnamed protein product [Ambrosiozyma monospora]|uniref:Unnamed protein product n=1 Tax=Ambrosiozyma monospora TaxID=43982 RepID=A0ACB5TCZ5_AMBMO|nr:unnamed protein product [Ambrosiozyma monospora]
MSTLNPPEKVTEAQEKVILQIVDLLLHWPPLTAKNSIVSSGLDKNLAELIPVVDKGISKVINELLESWSDLKVVYRIPKKTETGEAEGKSKSISLDDRRSRATSESMTRQKSLPSEPSVKKELWASVDISKWGPKQMVDGVPLPPNWVWTMDEKSGRRYYYHSKTKETQWEMPEWTEADVLPSGSSSANLDEEELKRIRELDRERERRRIIEIERERQRWREQEVKMEEERYNSINSIIKEASEEQKNSRHGASKPSRNGNYSNGNRNGHHSHDSSMVDENDDSRRRAEKQYKSLIGAIVPNSIRKAAPEMDKEKVKNLAKELVGILVEKEMRYHKGDAPPKELSDEKIRKIKKYTTEFTRKKVERSKRHLPHGPRGSSYHSHDHDSHDSKRHRSR